MVREQNASINRFTLKHQRKNEASYDSYERESVLWPLLVWDSLTLSLSCLLLFGPFHWTMVLPISSKKTSPRLKLIQLIST